MPCAAPATTTQRVLDYGCGPGRIAWAVANAGFVVEGVDPSSAMVVEARSLPPTKGRPDVPGGVQQRRRPRTGLLPRDCLFERHRNSSPTLMHCSRILVAPLFPVACWRSSYSNKHNLWRAPTRLSDTVAGFATSKPHNIWSLGQARSALSLAGFTSISRPTFSEASPFDKRRYLPFLSTISVCFGPAGPKGHGPLQR